MKNLLVLTLLGLCSVTFAGDFQIAPQSGPATLGEPDILSEEDAFRLEAVALSRDELLVRFSMPKNYYLYRRKAEFTTVNPEGLVFGQAKWPKGVDHEDEHFGQVEVFFDVVDISLPIAAIDPGASSLTLRARFQGCLQDKVCYPPMRRDVVVALPNAAKP